MFWNLLSLVLAASPSLGQIVGDHITIHIVTHTHDDTGWIISADEYYIQDVQWIFYTMMPVLAANPERKFTYVEMAFFYRWWNEQTDDTKDSVRKLIDDGQLQLNLAGWYFSQLSHFSSFHLPHIGV